MNKRKKERTPESQNLKKIMNEQKRERKKE